jgi:hypothetical protein
LPFYVTMTNMNSFFVILPTKIWWSNEPGSCMKGAFQKKREWRNILCTRRRLLLHAKCTVTRKRKTVVAGTMIN